MLISVSFNLVNENLTLSIKISCFCQNKTQIFLPDVNIPHIPSHASQDCNAFPVQSFAILSSQVLHGRSLPCNLARHMLFFNYIKLKVPLVHVRFSPPCSTQLHVIWMHPQRSQTPLSLTAIYPIKLKKKRKKLKHSSCMVSTSNCFDPNFVSLRRQLV